MYGRCVRLEYLCNCHGPYSWEVALSYALLLTKDFKSFFTKRCYLYKCNYARIGKAVSVGCASFFLL